MSVDKQLVGFIKALLSSTLFAILLLVIIGAYIFQMALLIKDNVKPEIYHYSGRCIQNGDDKWVSGNIGIVFLENSIMEKYDELEEAIAEKEDCNGYSEIKIMVQNIKELKLGN